MLHSKGQPGRNGMNYLKAAMLVALCACGADLLGPQLTLQAASISKQQADLFSRKVAQIVVQGDAVQKPGTRRTAFSETELNSWFAYSAQPLLPAGVSDPHVTMIGNGKMTGQATVDLDAIAKKKASGGAFDIWSLIGGRVPVNVAGTLHTKDGLGTFDLERADISGV